MIDMPTRRLRLANLLGALGLGVSDLLRQASDDATGHGGETAAALVTLGAEAGFSVGELARALALSHAGTVRLVDRLEADGLVTRRADEKDARQRRLALTALGATRRNAILAARAEKLAPLTETLTPDDVAAFERVAASLLATMTTDLARSYELCRLCDEEACMRGGCPVEDCLASRL